LIFRHASTVQLPKNNPKRKTDKYLSLPEACQMIGIDAKTCRRKEGNLFAKAKRLPNGFRIFTPEEVRTLLKIWRERGNFR
jgi:predicted site-specific integrase-resolvase